MAFDPSVFAQANKPSVNLLDPDVIMKQKADAASAVNANRLWQANQLAGQAQQAAIDPGTGQFSQSRLNQNLAALPPSAGIAVPTAIAQGQTQASAQQAMSVSKQDLAAKQATFATTALSSLMSANGGQGPTMDDVHQTLQRGIAAGVMGQTEANSMLIGMPTADDPRSMSTRLHIIQTMNEQAQSAQQRLQNASRTPVDVDMGNGVQPSERGGLLSGNPNAVSPVGSLIPRSTGPDTNAQLVDVQVPDPNNPGQMVPAKIPRSALPGASGTTSASPFPAGPSAMGSGRYPRQPGAAAQPGAPAQPGAALTGPAAVPASPQIPPVAGAPASTTGAPGGPTIVGNAVITGQSPATTANNATDAAAYKQAQLAIPNTNNSIQNLQHAYDALQLTNAGKSTETTHAMYSLLTTQGLLPEHFTDDVKNYDLFRKYTERYVADQGNLSGTDAGRALAAASNAGTSISTGANNDVLRSEIGKQRQVLAQVMEAPDKSGVGYGAHSSNFSSRIDPRGFAIDMYSPTEVQKLVQSMPNDTARNRFWKAAGIAQRLGMVSPPKPAGR